MKSIRMSGLLLLALLGSAVPAAAELQVLIQSPVVTVPRGTTHTFRVSLTGDTTAETFLTGLGSNLPQALTAGAAVDSFLQQAPLSLGPQEVWNGPLVTITATPEAPVGRETYAVTLFGGRTDRNSELLATVLLEVEVVDPACQVAIDTQPVSTEVAAGQPASFSVTASGAGAVYEWRRDGIAMSDGAGISGSATSTLAFASASPADSGYYDVRVSNACGSAVSDPVHLGVTSGTVDAGAPLAAPLLALSNPIPNPFGSSTSIRWSTPAPGLVRLVVYDLAGRRVATLASGWHGAGSHLVVWDGVTAGGRKAVAGVYWVRLQAEDRTLIQRLVRLP